ncbi:MAG TPA: hypothetical protein DEH78_25055 [Solibacterales bacterium]|nr:hypothetical protein [Bryobacterales bacterium]
MREGWPAMPVSRVRTLESVWAAEMADRRPMALLGTGLAVVALLLASVGVYGLLAYSVAQRIPEFGVRVALGARAWDILASAIRRGALAAMAGIVCGLAASLVFARLMQGLLYGVKPLDPATFVLAPAAVLLLSVMACLAPARTALRIDPARALRSE